MVLLAKNLSTNLFTQLTIRDNNNGRLSGQNFWEYLTNLNWGAEGGKLANMINRRLEKARNYAYCTKSAHIKIPLKVRQVHFCYVFVSLKSFSILLIVFQDA